jgi:hypothetical protein
VWGYAGDARKHAVPPTEEAVIADWILIPCLVRLRAEFDKVAPARDRASDGTIGDAAHRNRVSDHNPDETGAVPIRDADRTNEVHAIDVDEDLRTAGLSMEGVVQFLLARCRSGAETRLRYIIFNRRIWEASNDWKQETYSGNNPHTEHAHFSGSYVSALEADIRPWRLEDLIEKEPDVATQFNADDQTVLYERAKDITDLTNWPTGGGQKSDVGNGVWNAGFPLTSGATRTPAWANFQTLYELLADVKTQLDGIEARQIADSQVIQKLDLDPADEPPQLNPIVIGCRHAIANP